MTTQNYFTGTSGTRVTREGKKHCCKLTCTPLACHKTHAAHRILASRLLQAKRRQGVKPHPECLPDIRGALPQCSWDKTCSAQLANPAELISICGASTVLPGNCGPHSARPGMSILLNTAAPGQKSAEAPTPTPSPFLLRGSEVLPPPPPPLPNSMHKAPPLNTQKVCV